MCYLSFLIVHYMCEDEQILHLSEVYRARQHHFELWFCQTWHDTWDHTWSVSKQDHSCGTNVWVLLMPCWAEIQALQLPLTMAVVPFVLDEMQNQFHALKAINDPTRFPNGNPQFPYHVMGFIHFSALHFTLRLVLFTLR